VDGNVFGIERSYARRGHNEVALVGFGRNISEKGGLARARFSGQENVAVGAVDKARGQFEALGGFGGVHYFVFSEKLPLKNGQRSK